MVLPSLRFYISGYNFFFLQDRAASILGKLRRMDGVLVVMFRGQMFARVKKT